MDRARRILAAMGRCRNKRRSWFACRLSVAVAVSFLVASVNAKDALLLAVVVGVGYVIWKGSGIAKDVIDKASTAIADLWLTLKPLPPAIELLGNVKFPGNILIPLQQLSNARAVKGDAQGRVFVKYADMIWQLSPSNAYGNWEATRV